MLNTIFIGALGLEGLEAVIVLFLIVLMLIPFVFYLITLQRTLEKISPENRKMEPGQVWLMFIPLFNLGWQFVIVNRIAASLKQEFAKRNIVISEENPGQGVGIAMCVCHCCNIIPVLNILTSIGGLVCWIIYWVNISKYKSFL